MHSDLARKIEKARHYAEEPKRIQLQELKAKFVGENDSHQISLKDGQWNCSCSFFRSWKTCAHIMTAQKLLDPMLPKEARQPELAFEQSIAVLA
jgi:hypothetical protein